MDDNAITHHARIVNAYLEDQGIHWMYWPARSPDVSPIKHAWDMLQRWVSAHQPKPSTRVEPAVTLIEEWVMTPQFDICKLIRSFPTRLREVIQARGGNTRF